MALAAAPVWTGLTTGAVAVGTLLARRLSTGVWETVLHEPPPTSKA